MENFLMWVTEWVGRGWPGPQTPPPPLQEYKRVQVKLQ